MNVKEEAFCYGVDVSPWWFLQKVESKDIEYVHSGGKVVGCRFYDVYKHEQVFGIGDIIYVSMLYDDEPKEKQELSTKYRYYSTE